MIIILTGLLCQCVAVVKQDYSSHKTNRPIKLITPQDISPQIFQTLHPTIIFECIDGGNSSAKVFHIVASNETLCWWYKTNVLRSLGCSPCCHLLQWRTSDTGCFREFVGAVGSRWFVIGLVPIIVVVLCVSIFDQMFICTSTLAPTREDKFGMHTAGYRQQ